jgi:type I restriction enzyme S subunit
VSPPTFRLGDLLEVQNGYAFSSDFFAVDAPIGLIRIRDLKRGTSTEVGYVGDYDADYVVHAGDLLVGMDGEFRCYRWAGDPALLNQRVCRLRHFDPRLEPGYLLYSLDFFLKKIEDETGYVTVKHLSSKTIKNIEMTIPPVTEQRRVVALLDKATQHIADLESAYTQTLGKFDDLRASTLRTVLFGDVTTEIRELNDVAAVEYGERVVRARDGGTIYPVYGGGGATFSIDRYNREDCYIVSRFGMSETCVRHVEGKFFLNDSGLSVRTTNASVLCQEYLDRVLLANQDRIFAMSTGTAQKNLDVPSFRKFPIPVPTMADQRRLVTAYDEIERSAMRGDALTRQRLDRARSLRQAVLEAAFRGEL